MAPCRKVTKKLKYAVQKIQIDGFHISFSQIFYYFHFQKSTLAGGRMQEGSLLMMLAGTALLI